MKATKTTNCSMCEKRRDCWNDEAYGDRGEKGKKPYPNNCVCQSFRYDEKTGGYYR